MVDTNKNLKDVIAEYVDVIRQLTPYNFDVVRPGWGHSPFSEGDKYRPTFVFTIRSMDDAQNFIEDIADVLGRPMQKMVKRKLTDCFRVFVTFETDFYDWGHGDEESDSYYDSPWYSVGYWFHEEYGVNMYGHNH